MGEPPRVSLTRPRSLPLYHHLHWYHVPSSPRPTSSGVEVAAASSAAPFGPHQAVGLDSSMHPAWDVSPADPSDAMAVPQVVTSPRRRGTPLRRVGAAVSANAAARSSSSSATDEADHDWDYSHLGSMPPRHAQQKVASRQAVLAWAAAAAADTWSASSGDAPVEDVESRNGGGGAHTPVRGDDAVLGGAASPPAAAVLSSGDMTAIRARYDALLADHPGHPLLLRNYANFLIHVCNDAVSAGPVLAAACAAAAEEESQYFSGRAGGDSLSGPVLANTARTLWEATRDGAAASRLFDAALQVAPDDCFVLAAYTAFLWQWEDHACVAGTCATDWGSCDTSTASAPMDAQTWAR